jgi:fatty acid desaturase
VPGWGPAWGLSPAFGTACKQSSREERQHVRSNYHRDCLRSLRREILPDALLVIHLWWLYALLGVIDLWWLYGWHVGATALVAFCGTASVALYKKGRKPVEAREPL